GTITPNTAVSIGNSVQLNGNCDVDSITVGPSGKLTVNPSMSATIRVANFYVLEAGELTIGTPSVPVQDGATIRIVFKDSPFDIVNDPFQWGHVLACFGKVTMHGF